MRAEKTDKQRARHLHFLTAFEKRLQCKVAVTEWKADKVTKYVDAFEGFIRK